MKPPEQALRRPQAVTRWPRERETSRPSIVDGSSALAAWPVDAYIREEVRRQGHDLNNPHDGGLRVKWMTAAWEWGRAESTTHRYPTLAHIAALGTMIEPFKNVDGLRRCGVRVGFRVCPPAEDVPRLLGSLVAAVADLSPLTWYKEFELIHPFIDANGRTGKVLLAWLSGPEYWDAPYFPPADLFGAPISNP